MKAQSNVLGPEAMALIKVMEQISSGQLKIVPDVLVQGGEGEGNILNAFIAKLIQGGQLAITAEVPSAKEIIVSPPFNEGGDEYEELAEEKSENIENQDQ